MQQIVGVRRIVEGEVFDEHLDLAGLGEADHLDQLGDGAPERRRDSAFVRRAGEVDRQGRVADPDDGEVPEDPGHLCGHAQGGTDADQVEDEFGALTLGDVLDALDGIVAGHQCLVGTHRLGDLQLVFRSIHRDNGCRTSRAP